jgi:hypothetical protein
MFHVDTHGRVYSLEGGDTIGERIERIGRIRTDFLDSNARISIKKIKKNPFVSARSVQSVLPSYLHLPKNTHIRAYLHETSPKILLNPNSNAFQNGTLMHHHRIAFHRRHIFCFRRNRFGITCRADRVIFPHYNFK